MAVTVDDGQAVSGVGVCAPDSLRCVTVPKVLLAVSE